MKTMLFFLGLVLLFTGLVGLVRGKVHSRLFATRVASLVPFILGAAVVFLTSAPPLFAPGSVEQPLVLPPTAASMLDHITANVAPTVRRAEDAEPEQQQAYPRWERQVMAAHERADKVLGQVGEVMAALDDGLLDRFTAWTRLSVLAIDLTQAKLSLHELQPPTVLDLSDRKVLEHGLNDLLDSLIHKRLAIAKLREFTQTTDTLALLDAQREMDHGHDLMVEGLSKLAQVRSRLAMTAQAADSSRWTD